jgi:hypothetical protein
MLRTVEVGAMGAFAEALEELAAFGPGTPGKFSASIARSALPNARYRVGAAPLRWLFHKAAERWCDLLVLPPRRGKRRYPRHVKIKRSNYARNRGKDASSSKTSPG